MSEIATTEFEQADWAGSGVVGIPIDLVCEKWIYYYWPLFESDAFIPQIRGEAPATRATIAFRGVLTRLITLYRGAGGLTRFALDLRSDTLPPEARLLLAQLRSKLQTTIVDGPVTHAGGSLETGRVFTYHAPSREIRFSTDMWRELSLVGHWIHDATILRWAELTSEITKGDIKPSAVIDLLLTVPTSERDVNAARETYKQQGTLECVWTGAALPKGKFDVDHIIPFSLWHNNDLWNLVPASPAVNANKKDKLPTRDLMHRRRDSLIGCWEILRDRHRPRFDHEAAKIGGPLYSPGTWQSSIFQAINDAIEFTAVQRGSERWQP